VAKTGKSWSLAVKARGGLHLPVRGYAYGDNKSDR